MDVVNFVENVCGAKLNNWQKPHIRFLNELSRKYDVKIVMGKGGQVFTYIKQKGLVQNGSTNTCK